MCEIRRNFKEVVCTSLAGLAKAVANPVRVELLSLLSQGGRTVEELAELSEQSIANTSQHLQVLLRTRLVRREKKGLYAHYSLSAPEVGEFLRSLRLLAESQAVELEHARQQLLKEMGLAEPVERDEIIRRVREGESYIIDVRPESEYQTAHLPGAVSIPLEELDKHLNMLPRDREVVAYCRGPYCVLGVEAVRRLREKGYRAAHLDLGVWDWRAMGFPVES